MKILTEHLFLTKQIELLTKNGQRYLGINTITIHPAMAGRQTPNTIH